MEDVVIVSAVPHPHRGLWRRPVLHVRGGTRRSRHRRSLGAGPCRPCRGGRGAHGQHPSRWAGHEPRAPSRRQGKPSGHGARHDNQQDVRLRPQNSCPRCPSHQAGRCRRDGGWRHGEHEQSPVPPAPSPVRVSYGPRRGGGFHAQRRPVVPPSRLPTWASQPRT